jgi:methylated-DNA-[protein]-cysteine S-methyltransferase
MTPSLGLARVPSPLGALLVVSDPEGRLRGLDFAENEPRLRRLLREPVGSGTVPEPLRESLEAYFAGRLGALERVVTRTGGTGFQRRVWAALRRIPGGATTTYAALARAIGRPSACRAVGLANGANPIAIAIPCHRVIGANGALTGYAGGLERKRWLLDHERSWSDTP